MEPAGNAKLLPPPPLDELLNERRRQALTSETGDAETRRTGIDGDAITRRLILEDFDSSFLRFSEDTAGREYELKRRMYCCDLIRADTLAPRHHSAIVFVTLPRQGLFFRCSVSHSR